MKPNRPATLLLAAALLTPILGNSARAALAIANGDFSAAPAVDNSTDITGWYDYDSGNFWEQAWLESVDTPSGAALALAGGGFVGRPWAYQAIGTADGATTMTVSFDYGSFADAATPRDIGVTWQVYLVAGPFTPGQNVDVSTANGAVLLDSGSVSALAVAPRGNAGPAQITLNLAGAGTSQLYLRVTNFTPTTTANDNGYLWIDNISLSSVPEASGTALLSLGVMALTARRRRGQTT